MPDQHVIDFRVYYEDTDAGGVVYYANYLKYAERARTEMLRSKGIDQSQLAEKEGIIFVVRHLDMDLKQPARLDDVITVNTEVLELSGATILMRQSLAVGRQELLSINVKIACISKDFKPVRVPENIKQRLFQ